MCPAMVSAMSEQPVRLYPKMSNLLEGFSTKPEQASTVESGNDEVRDEVRLEPSTCVEAETFALRVLDDTMQPEFRKGCIILIDPTGRATDGSYVLATTLQDSVKEPSAENGSMAAEKDLAGNDSAKQNTDNPEQLLEQYLFRQLRQDANDKWYLQPLNSDYKNEIVEISLEDIAGVIVQRAGTRRSYHKHYD